MAQPQKKTKLVGHSNFKRHNPKTDRFEILKFDHVEFYCGDSINTAERFGMGLGMQLVAKSDQSTGNHVYSSLVMQTGETKFVFTAPYGSEAIKHAANPKTPPHPAYDNKFANEFLAKHGFAARAIAITVTDAHQAFQVSTDNGAKGILKPTTLTGDNGQEMVIAEVEMYGDVALRYIQRGSFTGSIFPGYEPTPIPGSGPRTFGIHRIDHIVGNVHNLLDTVNRIIGFTGFHELSEFVSEDVGTVDSGLNSMVLANNDEMVLLPINEPTFGTKRKSQIQTYLEQNQGEGVQHIALKTDDIFALIKQMRDMGSFGFMPKPSPKYYEHLPKKIGDVLTKDQYELVDELGLLVDKDEEGVLIQVFTKPVGDRPTLFLELIQRVGCTYEASKEEKKILMQKPACGGFGKGNFGALFKSIEDYEKSLE